MKLLEKVKFVMLFSFGNAFFLDSLGMTNVF